jgi:hypothetical protein
MLICRRRFVFTVNSDKIRLLLGESRRRQYGY